jgi:hypothetical protein
MNYAVLVILKELKTKEIIMNNLMQYFDYNDVAREDIRKIAHKLDKFFNNDIEGLSAQDQKEFKDYANKLLSIACRI